MTHQPDVRWMIVMTTRGMEHDVHKALHKREFDPWLWECSVERSYGPAHRRRRVRERRAYFSGYLFCRASDRDLSDQVITINGMPGVATVLNDLDRDTPDRRPLLVRDVSLQALATVVGVEGTKHFGYVPDRLPDPEPLFRPGDQVEILDGPFRRFLAIVEEASPPGGKERIRALVSVFGRPTPVQLDQRQVEKVG